MTGAVDRSGAAADPAASTLQWPATPAQSSRRSGGCRALAREPVGAPAGDLRVDRPGDAGRPGAGAAADRRRDGPERLRSGVDRELRRALALSPLGSAVAGAPRSERRRRPAPLRPGDPVGMSLVRGDLEMGATGTVTHVDGNRVYAFGHPFLNLGPTTFAMTQAHVYTVLPSLDTSMKIASWARDRHDDAGSRDGRRRHARRRPARARDERHAQLRQRARAPLQVLRPARRGADAALRLRRAAQRAHRLRAPVGSAHDRSDAARCRSAPTARSTSTTCSPATRAIAGRRGRGAGAGRRRGRRTNSARCCRSGRPRLRVSERQEIATIERVWLDTTKPKLGATHTLRCCCATTAARARRSRCRCRCRRRRAAR